GPMALWPCVALATAIGYPPASRDAAHHRANSFGPVPPLALSPLSRADPGHPGAGQSGGRYSFLAPASSEPLSLRITSSTWPSAAPFPFASIRTAEGKNPSR